MVDACREIVNGNQYYSVYLLESKNQEVETVNFLLLFSYTKFVSMLVTSVLYLHKKKKSTYIEDPMQGLLIFQEKYLYQKYFHPT